MGEKKEWFKNRDVIIVGSGIVGLSTAIRYAIAISTHYKVLILEKGVLPKEEARKMPDLFALEASELIHDLKTHSSQEVIDLVRLRWQGLNAMRELSGDDQIGYEGHGGYEIF